MRNLWLAQLLGTECLFGLALSQVAPKLIAGPVQNIILLSPGILFYGNLHRPIHDEDDSR
ncbi:hypothetical protein ISN45_At01g033570 [Arabidopsis thaliana x Arabidopsis arenosa]|uniref:Uncharacterized protein n=2 Tax=Arabidopsis TaxID=3701 RepID=A0A8T2HAT2_ARASU|nr:hypothetical protein ISN45_At01g033570 [Arabidopsis thaliana x Arabidopsis arenosa]KAG7656317.1 hypothetical protein ISN44_As01g033160 [Arabidopsis suecica]